MTMNESQAPVTTAEFIANMRGPYFNEIVANVNDHIVRLSVMTEPYFWHLHPESDETFIVVEGQMGIELANREVVLGVGEIMTVPRGVAHRTRPIGPRSVQMTFESAATTTVCVEKP